MVAFYSFCAKKKKKLNRVKNIASELLRFSSFVYLYCYFNIPYIDYSSMCYRIFNFITDLTISDLEESLLTVISDIVFIFVLRASHS